MRKESPVDLPCPGHRSRRLVRVAKGLFLILLTLQSLTVGVPLNLAEAAGGASKTPAPPGIDSQAPRYVNSNPVPDLSLPHTVLTNIDSLISSGGVIQSSSDNLTIYNLALAMRLRGGPLPHDELLGPGHRILSSYLFWGVEANLTGRWTPLIPVSNNFTIIRTNTTGTYVVRTMRVATLPYSGLFQIVYKATSAGPLKYDLLFIPAFSGNYRLTYTWANITSLQSTPQLPKHFQATFGTANYTLSWEDVPASLNTTTSLDLGLFTLSVDLGQLNSGSQVVVDPSIVNLLARVESTSYTFQRKIFYERDGGYYFLFYYDGFSIVYAYSHDGNVWNRGTPMPQGWPAYTDPASSSPFVLNTGHTVIVATGQANQTPFQCSRTPCQRDEWRAAVSLYYAVGEISEYAITWQTDPATGKQVRLVTILRYCSTAATACTLTLAIRYVSIALSPTGNLAFSFNFFASGPVTVGDGDGVCSPDWSTESDVAVVYQGGLGFADCENNDSPLRSAIMAADSQGSLRLVYQYYTGSRIQLRTRLVGGTVVSNSSLAPIADTYIEQPYGNADTNFERANPLHLQSPQQGYEVESDALVKFSPGLFSRIDSRSLFIGANLTFTVYRPGQGGDLLYAYEPSSPWFETSVTFNSRPGILLSSLSITPNATFANLVANEKFIVDVSNPLRGVVLGRWPDNGVFVQMRIDNHYVIPSLDLDSLESSVNSRPVLSIKYVCCMGGVEILEANEDSAGQFSVVADANYGSHVVFQGGTDGNVTYAYRPAGGPAWTSTTNIFSLCYPPIITRCLDSDPTLTVDYSTNDVYVLAILTPPQASSSLPSVIMKRKGLAQRWSDTSWVYAANDQYPTNLGSNLFSISGTNSSWLSITWTNAYPSRSGYSVMFESIPIQTVWSPFASPSDPWDGYGLAPYGEYFENRGEYVSASTGLLTVRQTDLSLPGRGLNLDIQRVYTEPYNFLGNTPTSLEPYNWAPLGLGWQLNFPWMSNTLGPRYLHLWNGEGYNIPSDFWNGSTGFLENHQGEHFQLVRNSTDMVLYSRTGIFYRFDPANHAMTKISDLLGNSITFTYSSNRISNITDSVGRSLLFCYNANGRLQRIDQAYGTCNAPSGHVRSVSYDTIGIDLLSVTDPAGRITRYSYGGANDPSVSYWLLSRIAYPTGWYTNYSYSASSIGTDSKTYRVTIQTVATTQDSTVKQFQYAYNNAPGGRIVGSTVQAYNGTQLASYTDYSFSFAGMSRNVSDASHKLVRGVQELFGVSGQVVREIVIVADTSTQPKLGTYTNYYRYDTWGNMIYSRKAINATANAYHDNYYAYYNNGLPPRFNAVEETFSQQQGKYTDNLWSAPAGSWVVKNGAYNGTATSSEPLSNMVWSDIAKPDLTIQVQIYLNRQLNSSDRRVGVFLHYPGTGTYKWGLVFHRRTAGYFLELLDDNGRGWLGDNSTQPSAKIPCSAPLGYWYTFNLTVTGYTASGWATQGQNICSVTGTFSSSSPAATGTGFGLYARDFSALFDNVTLAGSNKFSGFSSSFFPSGALGPSIHSALAGTAEVQGINSNAESYYSYYTWGGLNLIRRGGYSSNSTSTGWMWITGSHTYDAYGNPSSATDAGGNIVHYQYSSAYSYAYLTNQTSRDGSTQATILFTYDFPTGNRLTLLDPRGNSTSYQYDILGRTTRATYPGGLGFINYSYNDTANYVDITNEHNWKTRQVYDGLGRLSRTERVLGSSSYSNETLTYNWENLVTTRTGPAGSVYRYSYDPVGRILSLTKPDNARQVQVYNDTGSWVLTTDEDNNARCSIYDRQAHLVTIVEKSRTDCKPSSMGVVTNYWYDETGNLVKLIDGNLQTTYYSYDSFNRLARTTYPDSKSEAYSYNGNGRLSSRVDRNSVATIYSYDGLNRLKTLSYCGTLAATNYTYDKNSNIVRLQSQNATISSSYDARNRITNEAYLVNYGNAVQNQVCPPSGGGGDGSVAEGTLITLGGGTNVPVQNLKVGSSILSYDVSTSSFTQARITSLTTVYTSNMLIINTRDPLPLRVDNATAQKLWVRKSDGTVGWFSVTDVKVGDSLFKALDQRWTTVTKVGYAPAGVHKMYDIYTTAPYNYIANGYLDPVKRPVPTTTSTVTPLGSVSTATAPSTASYTVRYSYYGKVLSGIVYPDGLVANYTYDGLGRVASVLKPGGVTYASFSHFRDDQVSSIVFGNGLSEAFIYDTNRRPSQILLANGTSIPLSLNYAYNNTGTSASVTGRTVNTSGAPLTVNEQYKYDPLHRLTNSTVRTGSTTTSLWYEYDNLGNRKRQSANSVVTTYSYTPSNNDLASSTAPGTSTSYTYDFDGNTVRKDVNSGSATWTYTYNAESDLVKVANNVGTGGAYAYDGLGRRVESVETYTTFYAYLGTETLYEQVLTGSSSDYVYADGLRIARVTGTTVSYYHTDPLGSTRLVTSAAKTVLFSDSYQPFGQDNGAPTGSEVYKFTGKSFSVSSQLQYNFKRWYDPATGRFLSQDPLGGRLSILRA